MCSCLRAPRPLFSAVFHHGLMHSPTCPMGDLFKIVHEDDELLVINKPAGLVCHPTKTDEYSSLIGRIRLYFGAANTGARMVNRIDRETSGIVVVAKNVAVAGELGKIWESRAVQKEYSAIVHGRLIDPYRLVNAPLGKDEASEVAVKDCVRPDGSSAQTEIFLQTNFERNQEPFSLVRARPMTGRKHQIRIHLHFIGHPIVGDKLYGLDSSFYLDFVKDRLMPAQWQRLLLPHHALHAGELRFRFRDKERVFRAPPEPWFLEFANP